MFSLFFRKQKKPAVISKKLVVEASSPVEDKKLFVEVSKPIVEAPKPVVGIPKLAENLKPVVEVPKPVAEEITEKMSTRGLFIVGGSGPGSVKGSESESGKGTGGSLSVPVRRHGKSQSAFVSF